MSEEATPAPSSKKEKERQAIVQNRVSKVYDIEKCRRQIWKLEKDIEEKKKEIEGAKQVEIRMVDELVKTYPETKVLFEIAKEEKNETTSGGARKHKEPKVKLIQGQLDEVVKRLPKEPFLFVNFGKYVLAVVKNGDMADAKDRLLASGKIKATGKGKAMGTEYVKTK